MWGTIEFRVVLEKLPDSMPAEERRRVQLASIPASFDDPVPAFVPASAAPTGPADPPPAGVVTLDVSAREQSLIEAKRRAIEKARALAGRVRGRNQPTS